MIFKLRLPLLFTFLLLTLVLHPQPGAQMGVLHGEVKDPSGAVIPGAQLAFSRGSQLLYTYSGSDGHYAVRIPAPASYTIKVTAKGFAPYRAQGVKLVAGRTFQLDVPMEIATVHQEVTVMGHAAGVGVGSDQNSNSMVFRGNDLNALSDDPAELQSELETLAAATAGPNGGQIYIDGFAGGQLPPKSSILEIRVNQNPFSAEYDRVGYGRVEIITKPGSEKMHGNLTGFGNTSATNSANPLISQRSDYNFYSYTGSISGPIGKKASYFLSAYRMDNQNQSIVDALNPQNTAANLTEPVANPSSNTIVNPRLDLQAGKHTLSFNGFFYRTVQTGSSVGALSLPEQSVNGNYKESSLRVADDFIINAHLLNEIHGQWRRVRNDDVSASLAPAVYVPGAFVKGGNSLGVFQDHQDIIELQNYMTATAGNHTFRFGARARGYRDANYSTAGLNGTYTFSSVAAYLAGQPTQYTATVVNNPLARVWVVEGSGFFQDDWRAKPNLMIGLGVRWEGQNWIRDHSDWAPRVALAWSPGRPGSDPGKTVIRAGYGWFYERFTVPSAFSSVAGTPYVLQAIHDNRVNQQSYVVNNPTFYNPNAPVSQSVLSTSINSVPLFHSIDPHFKAALDMQAGFGIDQQIARRFTANLTYLYTQGVHQYLSNNVNAPAFNPASYTVTGTAPSVYNYQYQSGGFLPAAPDHLHQQRTNFAFCVEWLLYLQPGQERYAGREFVCFGCWEPGPRLRPGKFRCAPQGYAAEQLYGAVRVRVLFVV